MYIPVEGTHVSQLCSHMTRLVSIHPQLARVKMAISKSFYQIKNWETFQHYKRRNPPWIKLHRSILDDYNFSALPELSRLHLILLWLYASQNNGKIPNDIAYLKRKIDCVSLYLDILVNHGFLIDVEQNFNHLQRDNYNEEMK